MLGKKHLHELLGHQTTLLKEIRTLDSEMQVDNILSTSLKSIISALFTHRVIFHSVIQLEIIVFAAVIFYYNSVSQTLVYENYNKFISATDTIRRMKDDFKHMEEQMEVDLSIILERIFVFFGQSETGIFKILSEGRTSLVGC